MINQGVYNIFEIPDTNNTEAKWDLFQHLGCLPLKYVIAHIKKILITSDK